MKKFVQYKNFSQPEILNIKKILQVKPFSTNHETAVLVKKSILSTVAHLWWIDDSFCPGQKDNLWNTTYWSRELFLLAESVGAGKNAVKYNFSQFYNNKDVVPTFERKMVKFYNNEGSDILKLGGTKSKLTNNFLHSSTEAKFYAVMESEKDLPSKVPEDK